MKRILLTLLGIILVIGVLAGAGFVGYRIGLNQGVQKSANGGIPLPARPNRLGPLGIPNFDREFDRGFNREFPRGGFRMMHRGGFGFFGPLMFLGHIAFWGLIILLVYLLFTRSGWRITRTQTTIQSPSPSVGAESKPQEPESKNE